MDKVHSFIFNDFPIKGNITRLQNTSSRQFDNVYYPEHICFALSEAMAVVACLASGVKFNGKLSMQINCKQQYHLLIADYFTDGSLRAMARKSDLYKDSKQSKGCNDELAKKNLGLAKKNLGNGFNSDLSKSNIGDIFACGNVQIIIDNYETNKLYNSTVPIGKNFDEIIEYYMGNSEQILTKSICTSGKKILENRTDFLAANALIQLMPITNNIGKSDVESKQAFDRNQALDLWEEVSIIFKTLSSEEMLDETLLTPDLIRRLFHNYNVTLFPPKELSFNCQCSFDKIKSVLQKFSQQDINNIAVDGAIITNCEFCNREFKILKSELL